MPALRQHHRASARSKSRRALRLAPPAFRSGLTLIEMLMATAITLLMMAAIVNLFASMSSSISNRRAVIELNSQLRQVRQQLARDLAGCTVPPGDEGLMPWRQRPGEAIGYLEIVEGVHGDHSPSDLIGRDANGDVLTQDTNGDGLPDIDPTTSIIPSSQRLDPDSDLVTDAAALGDYDDILALTVRSLDEPFVAEVGGGNRVESNLAEVVWYASENPADGSQGEPGMRKIYRRVFLIAPWLGQIDNNAARVVSSHLDPLGSGNRIANTLADLTRREFRAGHEYEPANAASGYAFPHVFRYGQLTGDPFDSQYLVLNDALAFDVRVYDPGAPSLNVKGVVIEPTSPVWSPSVNNLTANPIIGYGAYVDLGWDDSGHPSNGGPNYTPSATAPVPIFQRERQVGWHPRFVLENNAPNLFRGSPAVYDTWTWHYENDGVNQDNVDNVPAAQWRFDNVDTARNGIDDDNINGVDDPGERETSPPYPVPLRGVKVLLRVYERDARQVREVSVTNSFVP